MSGCSQLTLHSSSSGWSNILKCSVLLVATTSDAALTRQSKTAWARGCCEYARPHEILTRKQQRVQALLLVPTPTHPQQLFCDSKHEHLCISRSPITPSLPPPPPAVVQPLPVALCCLLPVVCTQDATTPKGPSYILATSAREITSSLRRGRRTSTSLIGYIITTTSTGAPPHIDTVVATRTRRCLKRRSVAMLHRPASLALLAAPSPLPPRTLGLRSGEFSGRRRVRDVEQQRSSTFGGVVCSSAPPLALSRVRAERALQRFLGGPTADGLSELPEDILRQHVNIVHQRRGSAVEELVTLSAATVSEGAEPFSQSVTATPTLPSSPSIIQLTAHE